MFNRKKTKIPTFNNIKNPCILQFFDIEQPLKDQKRSIMIKAIITDCNDNKIVFENIIFSIENYKYYFLYKDYILNKKINVNIKLLKDSFNLSLNPLLNDSVFKAFFNCNKTNFQSKDINYNTEEMKTIIIYKTDGYNNKICLLNKKNESIKDNEISIDVPNIFHEIIIKNNTYFYNYLKKQQDLYKNIEIDNKYLNKNTFIYSYFFIKETKLPPKTISLLIEHFCFYGLDSDNLALKLLNIPVE